ncbi:MAG: hypothetical protein JWQ27_2779 [Ferruginibacter sp.]|nr:hypothetical protein [Ferruginibacter sp.]
MKIFTFAALLASFLVVSCSKSDDTSPVSPSASVYMTTASGSGWDYQQTNNTPPPATSLYSVTSTTRDTVVSGRSYHVYTNSTSGTSEYYYINGSDYYTYQSLPADLGGVKVENLYLKDNASVNTSWSQNFNITYMGLPLVVTMVNTIKEKAISRTVNGITYTNVIHVDSKISVGGIPASGLTTDIQSYYAPKVGLIENTTKVTLNYLGLVNNTDLKTILRGTNIP